jgi:uncharacterized protein
VLLPLAFAAALAIGLRALNTRPELPSHRAAVKPRPVLFTDSASDGTPDFLRLDDDRDQDSFRRWFSFLAEVQYYSPPAARPAEIVDCAALVRYAYREALCRHDSVWAASAHLPLVPAFDSVRKYSFPRTPLGPSLFRLTPGPFVPADLHRPAFGQFANAQSLRRFNTFFVSRSLALARQGDLLFYRRPTQHMPFHAMIFLAQSQIAPDGASYVVYHTGPGPDGPGEIRRLSLAQLLEYPAPQWRPISANPDFLGVFRWNILRTGS